jgi:carbon storage regulator CsrA
MLVLSRRCDTAIHIGRDIKVTVLSIRNRQVKLGIDAPASVRIWRDELCRGEPRLLENEDANMNAEETTQVQRT